ncbi:MAG: hypothetical protein HY088_04985 [Ignavibacteriales bacterium]|nr:hypothetical protein [Ignavibacteriales bacterium]
MKWWALELAVVLLIVSCRSTYPYLVTSENCNCESYVFKDGKHNIEIEIRATYHVGERVTSTVQITFRNKNKTALSLQQAYIKGTSTNVRYQFNDRYQPLPYVTIAPGTSYTILFEGSDTELVDEPWHKIAGEHITLELKGLMMGLQVVHPIVITMIPVNPKLN